MADRWRTGWVVGGQRAHRPDPDRPGYGMCGWGLNPHAAVHDRVPPEARRCGRCGTAVGAARRAAAVRAAVAAGRLPPLKGDPEQADRRDRAHERGTSIRTVSGGLPGLGRRQHR
jgi:hypothetical protein